MMDPTYNNYTGLAYGLPFSIFLLLFAIMTILNKRAQAFVVAGVLGITTSSDEKAPSVEKGSPDEKAPSVEKGSPDEEASRDENASPYGKASPDQKAPPDKKASPDGKASPDQKASPDKIASSHQASPILFLEQHVEKFLYIEQTMIQPKKPLPCILRLLSDFFSSAILGVLLEIIFEKCILANITLAVGDPCPDYNADCFGTYNGSRHFGPFQCTKGQNTSFPVTSTSVICYGWVYHTTSARDVLDAIGVSGGLLGLVACIVPFIYYVSFQKKPWWLSIFFIILPLSTIVAFILTIVYTYPEVVSVLTIIVFSLLMTMTWGGWIWAVVASYGHRKDADRDLKCCCTGRSCWKKHCSICNCCLKSYKNYPWCWCCCCKSNKIACTQTEV